MEWCSQSNSAMWLRHVTQFWTQDYDRIWCIFDWITRLRSLLYVTHTVHGQSFRLSTSMTFNIHVKNALSQLVGKLKKHFSIILDSHVKLTFVWLCRDSSNDFLLRKLIIITIDGILFSCSMFICYVKYKIQLSL